MINYKSILSKIYLNLRGKFQPLNDYAKLKFQIFKIENHLDLLQCFQEEQGFTEITEGTWSIKIIFTMGCVFKYAELISVCFEYNTETELKLRIVVYLVKVVMYQRKPEC